MAKSKTLGTVAKITAILILISLLGGGIIYIYNQGQKDEAKEGRLFTTEDIRIETEKLTNTPYNPIKVYLQGDTLKQQQKFIANLLDSTNRRNRVNDSLKIIKDSTLNISREARSSDIKTILDGVIRTNNIVEKVELRQKIVEDKLDSLIKN